AGLDAVRAPLEVGVRGVERAAVLAVGAEEREVERVAGVREVVRVAAEETEGLLGRGDEAEVVVAAEGVGGVAAAVVERDDLDAEAGLLASPRGGELGLERLDRGAARLGPLGVGLRGGGGGEHAL